MLFSLQPVDSKQAWANTRRYALEYILYLGKGVLSHCTESTTQHFGISLS